MRTIPSACMAVIALILSACGPEYEARFLAVDKTTLGIESATIQFCGADYKLEIKNRFITSKIKISCESEMKMIVNLKNGRSAKIMCGYFTDSARVDIILEITDDDLF